MYRSKPRLPHLAFHGRQLSPLYLYKRHPASRKNPSTRLRLPRQTRSLTQPSSVRCAQVQHRTSGMRPHPGTRRSAHETALSAPFPPSFALWLHCSPSLEAAPPPAWQTWPCRTYRYPRGFPSYSSGELPSPRRPCRRNKGARERGHQLHTGFSKAAASFRNEWPQG